MVAFVHFDEARSFALEEVRDWVGRDPGRQALLISDLLGLLRVVVFGGSGEKSLSEALKSRCGSWWTGDLLQSSDLDETTRQIFLEARDKAQVDERQPRLRTLDRHRSRTAWFSAPQIPPWTAPQEGPPIIVFYSFKGGLGRSTLLASFAIQRARLGERVAAIDLDLDSPGISNLLSADRDGLIASWGAVDFLLEHRAEGQVFSDYWHRCDRVADAGEIRVMPAGRLDAQFAEKLGRADLEESPSETESGLSRLIHSARSELQPDWILLDTRTGISELGGQVLSGIAHLHVLLGTPSEQNWQGLKLVLDRLGGDRVRTGVPQADVLLIQAMVPGGEGRMPTMERFSAQAETIFEDRYYADAAQDPEDFWTVNDKQSLDSPHVPSTIEYNPGLASIADIATVTEPLTSGGTPPHSCTTPKLTVRVEWFNS